MRGKVLDVGTGFAMLATTLARMNQDVDVVGLDISRKMIEAGRKEVHRKGLAGRIAFVEADARVMPFPDDCFDAVISFSSLHHWPDPVSILNEIDRVRKPGGMVFITDIRRDAPRPFVWLLCTAIRLRVGRRLAEELAASVHAAYLPSEIEAVLEKTTIRDWQPKHTLIDLNIFSPGKEGG